MSEYSDEENELLAQAKLDGLTSWGASRLFLEHGFKRSPNSIRHHWNKTLRSADVAGEDEPAAEPAGKGDDAFQQAMADAINSGKERASIGVRTDASTDAPRVTNGSTTVNLRSVAGWGF